MYITTYSFFKDQTLEKIKETMKATLGIKAYQSTVHESNNYSQYSLGSIFDHYAR